MTNPLNDLELARYREVIRANAASLDKLMADGKGHDLMTAAAKVVAAGQLFMQRLVEIK